MSSQNIDATYVHSTLVSYVQHLVSDAASTVGTQWPFFKLMTEKKRVITIPKKRTGYKIWGDIYTATDVDKFTDPVAASTPKEADSAEWTIKGAKSALRFDGDIILECAGVAQTINNQLRAFSKNMSKDERKAKTEFIIGAQIQDVLKSLSIEEAKNAVIRKMHGRCMNESTYYGSLTSMFDLTGNGTPSSSHAGLNWNTIPEHTRPFYMYAGGGSGTVHEDFGSRTLTGNNPMDLSALQFSVMQMLKANASRGGYDVALMNPNDLDLLSKAAIDKFNYNINADLNAGLVTKVPAEIMMKKTGFNLSFDVSVLLGGLPVLEEIYVPTGFVVLMNTNLVSIDVNNQQLDSELVLANGMKAKVADVSFIKQDMGSFLYTVGADVKTSGSGIGYGSLMECGAFASLNPNKPYAMGVVKWDPTTISKGDS